MGLIQQGRKFRRGFYEFFGSDHYSKPALNNIDLKLSKYLNFRGGFFIEAGANDGYTQSNTYYLEKMKRWRGILIEPIPALYEKCVRERSKSFVFNCALVPLDYQEDSVIMRYANLMSLVKGARKSEEMDTEHITRGIEVQKDVKGTYEITVPGRTLTSILNEVGEEKIDLLSLDVEGYELGTLKGLDLDKYRPAHILIETNFQAEIDGYLTVFGYKEIDKFSDHDVLYKLR